ASAASAAPVQLAADVPVDFDRTALHGASLNAVAYGRALTAQLFAFPQLREAWLKARAYAATGSLQLRLYLNARADDLHALRWETLLDPETDQPITLHERVRFVRTLDSADLTPIVIPLRPTLRTLVVVSNPINLDSFSLAEVDVDGEVSRARTALGGIPSIILGDHPDAVGRATLANVIAQLRDEPPIVILAAHGSLRDDMPYLWLEQEDGTVDHIAGEAFVSAVERLGVRPLFLALLSCQSSGRGYGDALRALGPQLARAGVPSVLGFQGDVALSTVKILLPTLITELRRDGRIDRALAAARFALEAKQRLWWQAVLWLRTDGRLWREESSASPTAGGVQISGNVGTVQQVTVTGGNVGSIIGSQQNVSPAESPAQPPNEAEAQ
ncbi:MAG: CHAT domain-containing protein, partial [Chloroflexales bacterium]|nr:CHAT domain-containing protein [Chloroflexales bacterium]